MGSDYDISKFIGDKYSKLILKSTMTPKHIDEIGKDTKIPITTIYRRLKVLKNMGFLKISGSIRNGVYITTYHNKPRKYNVLNPRIVFLLKIITKNPGIGYREIQKISGMPNGTLTNFLSNLEKDSKILVRRSTRRANYFPKHIPPEKHLTLINLRKETTKQIILFLVNNKRGTFSEIKNISNKSNSTISITLTNLIESGIIRRVIGLHPHFELQDLPDIQNTINLIEPNIADKMKDRFADTFSYF